TRSCGPAGRPLRLNTVFCVMISVGPSATEAVSPVDRPATVPDTLLVTCAVAAEHERWLADNSAAVPYSTSRLKPRVTEPCSVAIPPRAPIGTWNTLLASPRTRVQAEASF